MQHLVTSASRLFLEETGPLPSKPPKLKTRPRVAAEYSRWVPHPGEGLTPRRLVGAYRLAEYGYPQEQCDLFDDVIESDAHLRSQLETRANSVAGKEWLIQAGGDDAKDLKAAELLEDSLREVEDFTEMMEHQLSALRYGWAVTDTSSWEMNDYGVYAPRWFDNVAAREILFDKYLQPRLMTEDHMLDGIELAAGEWWFNRRPHRTPARAGLMRTATWWSLFKRMSIRDWVAFAERFGLPLAIGKYRDDMPDVEKEAVRRAVAMVGKDGYAAFSESGSIEFAKIDFSGANEVHPTLAGFCNAEISKLITGATLTTGEGTSTGSYALGHVHENVAFGLVASDAKRLGDQFAFKIGLPFVRWNGLDCRPPRLKIQVVREQDPAGRMELMSHAANDLGLALDEDQVRQELQLKRPSGTALVGRGRAMPGMPGAAPGTPPAQQPGGTPADPALPVPPTPPAPPPPIAPRPKQQEPAA